MACRINHLVLKEDDVSSQPAPYGREVRIRIGGPAGFGIKAAGQTLARVFARSGYHTFDLTEYPSLIKGGHNTYHLRVSEDEIFSHVMPTDILLALDAQTVGLHLAELTNGAAVVFDPKDVSADELDLAGRDDLCLVPVPLTDIVYEVGGIKIMRNVVALGAVLGQLGFPLERLLDSLKAQFAHKAPEVAEQNIAAASRGYETAQEIHCAFPHHLEPLEPQPYALVDGNEACGLGALAAGIGFYAAYPMTPASSLLNFMAKHAESQDVVFKHTEDEIAAINMVIGASFGGTRAMCATSGGGFALMVEALGFAGVSESAVVIGLFTRPGPATGLPTWTEQSDLRFAIHAAQGEFPRVVLAPGDHADMFTLTWQAFNLADRLQTPVIILGDTYLSENRQTMPPLQTYDLAIDRGELQVEGKVTDYERYAVTESGVSPRVLPGVTGALQLVNSYEHDAHGWATEDAAVRDAQNAKRLRKQALAAQWAPPAVEIGPRKADMSILLFGTTKMPAREAMKWLEADGISVNLLQLVTVWPFPARQVAEFLERSSRSIIIEGNATGQLEGLVREHCFREPGHRLHRTDGRPFSPELIYATIKRILGEQVDLTDAGALATEQGAR
jgi:2-oxoglutarate ferredoxin oxidoreductase subunit alpha